MTKMTTLREAAQQALEALGFSCPAPHLMSKHDAAITALRAALERPERHVSYVCPQCHWSLEQQEQEPVAWGVDWGRDNDQSCCTIIKRHANGTQEIVAVEYGPPRREWQGLTGDETMHLMNETAGNSGWADEAHIQRLRRAIEQALRSKNHE